MTKYAKLYYQSVVFSNDMKHIHTHAIGNKFDRLHSISNEYYEKASEDSDLFVELALEFGEKVRNPSDAAAIIGYDFADADSYDWDDGIQQIMARMEAYIAAMEELRKSNIPADVQSLLDDIIRYWKKENRYKNVARTKE